MTDRARVLAVVPVKRFAIAKSRLAPVLDCRERESLARAMFEDVLETLLQCQDVLAGTMVVTSDAGAAGTARTLGAEVIFEDGDNGINAAVRLAVDRLACSTDTGVVVVPSDLPQLTRRAIAKAVAAIARPMSLAIAAAPKDGGTNLLACRPAAAIPLHFGPHSFVQHSRAAQQAGLTVRALRMPELLLDIDWAEDLQAFQSLRTKTRTHAFLSSALVRTGADGRSRRKPQHAFCKPAEP